MPTDKTHNLWVDRPDDRQRDEAMPSTPCGPLRAAECHLARTLTELAKWLQASARQLSSGAEIQYVTVEKIATLVEELDGRSRGLLLHYDEVREYERRRQRFPAVCKQAMLAVRAVRHLREQVPECLQWQQDRRMIAPLICLCEQVAMQFVIIARALEQDNRESRRELKEIVNQSGEQWYEIEEIIAELCCTLKPDERAMLCQMVELLHVSSTAVVAMVETLYDIAPEVREVSPLAPAPPIVRRPVAPAAAPVGTNAVVQKGGASMPVAKNKSLSGLKSLLLLGKSLTARKKVAESALIAALLHRL